MSHDFIFAWGVYASSCCFLILVVFRLTRTVQNDLRMILRVLSVSFLLTPAKLAPDSPIWVPAFIAALLDSVTIDMDAGAQRLWPLLMVMLAVLIISLAWKYLVAKKVQPE